ncbi:signal transduction histidine kinase [Larkinella arboricola]|uniref:histidine kinase n=1 Tax=Larkinella arboricola TaxID=643671 RepID=A0A327WV39_LARAB|nr:HAMP domain-containing sensor histidine kinase [Larkinella arboricola]RAJ95556.1 signal transduction histidine kinase [Larkinella arboricola]
MKIRARISLTFLITVAANLVLFSLVIYFISEYFRQRDFYNRLVDKAKTTASLLIEENEINSALLQLIERKNLTSLPEEHIIIYNQQNKIMYASANTSSEMADRNNLLTRIRERKQLYLRRNRREIVGIAYTYQNQEYIIIASAYDEYGLIEMAHLRKILGFGLAFSLALVGLSGWIFAGRFLRPISNVIRQVDQIKVSNLNQRVDAGDNSDEIAQLAHTFNSMLDRVQEAFEVQRNFVANASHELRTPLTIITGQIEVTLIKQRTVEEHEAKWKSVLEVIKRLNLLANNLLELAQVSLDDATMKFNEVSLDDAIYQATRMLTTRRPDYHVIFSFEKETEAMQSSLTVQGSLSLLISAFVNLMENGCKFSANNRVEVIMGANEQWVTIQFKDEGIGIDEADIKHIYEPFFRAENAKRIHGYGIGLPLTYRIIQLHRGQINVSSRINEGTNFLLKFPKKL